MFDGSERTCSGMTRLCFEHRTQTQTRSLKSCEMMRRSKSGPSLPQIDPTKTPPGGKQNYRLMAKEVENQSAGTIAHLLRRAVSMTGTTFIRCDSSGRAANVGRAKHAFDASGFLVMVRRLALCLMTRKCWVRKAGRTAAQQMTRCFGDLGPPPSSAFRAQRNPSLCRLLHPLCALPVLRGCSLRA
jgi:hypothetical protein